MAETSSKTLSGATGKALAEEIKKMREEGGLSNSDEGGRLYESYHRYREARDLLLKQEYFDWSGPLYFQDDPQVLFAALYAPFQLERFLLLGISICLDCLLYVYTFLPLQLATLSWYSIAARVCPRRRTGRKAFHIYPRHITTIVNAAVLATATVLLTLIDDQAVEGILLAPQRNHMIGVHIVVIMEVVRWFDSVLLQVLYVV